MTIPKLVEKFQSVSDRLVELCDLSIDLTVVFLSLVFKGENLMVFLVLIEVEVCGNLMNLTIDLIINFCPLALDYFDQFVA